MTCSTASFLHLHLQERERTVGHACDSPGTDYAHYYKLENRSYRERSNTKSIKKSCERHQLHARHGEQLRLGGTTSKAQDMLTRGARNREA